MALLHHLKQPTLFTRDEHFFKRGWCHRAYALSWLDAAPEECALFIRRWLQHPRFRHKADRMGIVARAHHDGVHFWKRNHANLQHMEWTKA